MANPSHAVSLFAIALCFSSLLGFAHCQETTVQSLKLKFDVKGKVYCDTCRVQFETEVSEYISGAKVRLECRDREGGSVGYSVEGETDKTGTYHLAVEGDHENEICEVVVIKSDRQDCSERIPGSRARIVLATNGISSPVRLANTIGFMKKDPLKVCPEVLKKLGFLSTGSLV